MRFRTEKGSVEFDLMTAGSTWTGTAELARRVESAGFSGLLWTEIYQVPWMQIAAAATAAPTLTFTTGIAVAFPRSPMLSAQVAWELAGNTGGRFRLGLGSQVKAHITRRYGTDYDRPAERMRDYVGAVKACLAAFRREEPLSYEGCFYQLNLLPGWAIPPAHDHGDVKVHISAVGPLMVKVAAELADGVHVHPLHSMPYLHNRLLPSLAEGAKAVGRDPAEVDLIIPVFVVPGDTSEERAGLARRARGQIAFYGTTPNYSFQFDDLGYAGMTSRLGERLRAGDTEGMTDLITDEILDHFAVVGTWDEVADKLRDATRAWPPGWSPTWVRTSSAPTPSSGPAGASWPERCREPADPTGRRNCGRLSCGLQDKRPRLQHTKDYDTRNFGVPALRRAPAVRPD